jgi:hypothetical protein
MLDLQMLEVVFESDRGPITLPHLPFVAIDFTIYVEWVLDSIFDNLGSRVQITPVNFQNSPKIAFLGMCPVVSSFYNQRTSVAQKLAPEWRAGHNEFHSFVSWICEVFSAERTFEADSTLTADRMTGRASVDRSQGHVFANRAFQSLLELFGWS